MEWSIIYDSSRRVNDAIYSHQIKWNKTGLSWLCPMNTMYFVEEILNFKLQYIIKQQWFIRLYKAVTLLSDLYREQSDDATHYPADDYAQHSIHVGGNETLVYGHLPQMWGPWHWPCTHMQPLTTHIFVGTTYPSRKAYMNLIQLRLTYVCFIQMTPLKIHCLHRMVGSNVLNWQFNVLLAFIANTQKSPQYSTLCHL